MNVIVVDDFLPKPEFDVLHDLLMGETDEASPESFQWRVNMTGSPPAGDTTQAEAEVCKYQIHTLFEAGHVSPWFEVFEPILRNIESKLQFTIHELIRVRANLYTNTGIPTAHPDHIDQSFPHAVAMFYINTCNGPTTINGTDYDCVANRMILFDGEYRHHSNLQTDTKVRVNVNINITGAFR